MNYFTTSTGEKVSKSIIDYRVRKAKAKVLQDQLDEHGYNFCVVCGRNDCKPIDCSHDVSVNDCQNSGRCELAWDTNNIKPTGRPCHKLKDGNLIMSGK